MLAIVIPYYKLMFFEETLKSLSNQTDMRFNVYIGNDGSPENPEQIISKYENQFHLFYKKFDINLGKKALTHHWNRCLDMIKDEQWTTVLCDDDILSDNYVESFYKHIESVDKNKAMVIRFDTQIIDYNGEITSQVFTHPKIETSKDFFIRKLKGGTRSSLSEFIFESKNLKKCKFKNLPLAWYSDYLAVFEVSDFKEIYTISDAVVYFRMSGINITSKNNDLEEKNIATFGFYYYLLSKFKEKFNKEEQEVLYFKLEKTFLDNKKNPYFWVKLTSLYLLTFQIKRYFKFIMKMIKLIAAKLNTR